jgi:hypothetical protein
MEEDYINPFDKKERKKRTKQFRYKDVFDKPAHPNKKITIVKSKIKKD